MIQSQFTPQLNLLAVCIISTLVISFIIFLVAFILYIKRCRVIKNEVDRGLPERKPHGGLHAILAFLGISIVIVLNVVFYSQVRANPGNFGRKANRGDIAIESDIDFSKLGTQIIVTPQNDIYELSVKVDLLDSNKNTLYSVNKSLGDVKKGKDSKFTISLSDVGFSVSINTTYVRVDVIGGSICYFV